MGGFLKFFWALLLWSGKLNKYLSPFVVSAWVSPVAKRHNNRSNSLRPTTRFPIHHRYIQQSSAAAASDNGSDEHTRTASTSQPNTDDSFQGETKNRPPPKQIGMPVSKRKCQVWKTIHRLQQILDQTTSQDSFPLYPASRSLVAEVVSILTTLATQHEGSIEWQGLLNKSTLLHEVEESILAIHFLQQEWKHRPNPKRTVVLVDVCCGKGVFSLLASYFFANNPNNNDNEISIAKIIMLDKDPKLRWDHIHASNMDSKSTNDGHRPWIECWPRFNLHDMDELVQRLEAQLDEISASNTDSDTELAMVGIHLCKTLSPACIGIANLLGPQKCPHFVLAPCCLPRVVVQSKYKPKQNSKPVLQVRQYETEQQTHQRRLARERRTMAMVRGKGSNAMGACWKCGEFGHVKADCPSDQSTSKPSLVKPPTMELDVSGILGNEQPFGSYCQLLTTSIQRKTVAVRETGLTNNHMVGAKQQQANKQEANNWNRDRKSIYIVASERHTSP